MSISYHDSNTRMSQATVHNGVVYLAGQVPDDTSADISGQTEQVLAKIDRLLAAAGTSKENILSALVWVTDMSEFAEMNKVWDAWVVPGRPPARAATEAKLALPDFKVEIMVTAAIPEA